jgi:hypothetical protein
MATLIRIDEHYINLDQVTRIEVHPEAEEVEVCFVGVLDNRSDGYMVDTVTLRGERGARFLKWLDAGGRVSEA